MPIQAPMPLGLGQDPLHRHLFFVAFEDGLFPATGARREFDYAYVKEVQELPQLTMETAQQRQQLLKRNYFTGLALSPLTIVFYEDRIGTIQRFFYDWVGKMVDPTNGNCLLPPSYKKTIQVELLNYDGQPHRTYKYLGMPMQLSGFNMSTEEGAIITPTVRFAVDEILFDVASSPPLGQPT